MTRVAQSFPLEALMVTLPFLLPTAFTRPLLLTVARDVLLDVQVILPGMLITLSCVVSP